MGKPPCSTLAKHHSPSMAIQERQDPSAKSGRAHYLRTCRHFRACKRYDAGGPQRSPSSAQTTAGTRLHRAWRWDYGGKETLAATDAIGDQCGRCSSAAEPLWTGATTQELTIAGCHP
eukprot:scaffold28171_cov81-Cyclotella_meneghiniana.AAC.2